jgi:aldehyde dehydrogenase (NAD+)
LGGKSAAIVHDDADLDSFENDIRWGIYFNAGQVCSAMSRVIVHESRAAELVERAEKVAASLSIGPGIERPEFGPNMGAMVSRDATTDRAARMIETAQAQGARVVTGGRPLNRPGAFLEPTVLADVTPDMEIAQQGGLRPGPVGPALPRRGGGHRDRQWHRLRAGRRCLHRRSGPRHARGKAAACRTGLCKRMVCRRRGNAVRRVRKSGYGREKGREALWNYVQTKNVAIKRR